ncbi:MAG: glycine cleavage system aminomethyltransferase GcvT [Wenzhouxiangellaceae bacterium]
MSRTTPLFPEHQHLGAQMVDFAGWSMPIRYGSLLDEHHAVRQAAGIFDVSHMAVVDVRGAGARDFLRRLLANDVAKLAQTMRAQYTCMLNPQGGIIDDLIVYYFADDAYRLVVNAATRDGDIAWIGQQAADFEVDIKERSDLAMVAVQGPKAIRLLAATLGRNPATAVQELKPFHVWREEHWTIARTGYTGEDGCEILLPQDDVVPLWRELIARGVTPCGLGARDTLRLEAGLNLYGQDMDDSTTPLQSALGWTVAWEPEDRDFIGRQALAEQRSAGVADKLVGLVLDDRAVLRHGQTVTDLDGQPAGVVTSGTFGPTVGKPLGFARIRREVEERCQVEIRGKQYLARIVRPPFVRHGKIQPGILPDTD